jgi:hypothetical protein
MITIHPEFFVDEKQNRKMVLLPLLEWDKILADLDELDDIRAYDAAQKGRQESIPFEQAVQEIQAGYKA